MEALKWQYPVPAWIHGLGVVALTGLSTEHGATTAVMMEPCFLLCRHIEASLIPMSARGWHQHRAEGPGVVDAPLIAGWAG